MGLLHWRNCCSCVFHRPLRNSSCAEWVCTSMKHEFILKWVGGAYLGFVSHELYGFLFFMKCTLNFLFTVTIIFVSNNKTQSVWTIYTSTSASIHFNTVTLLILLKIDQCKQAINGKCIVSTVQLMRTETISDDNPIPDWMKLPALIQIKIQKIRFILPHIYS